MTHQPAAVPVDAVLEDIVACVRECAAPELIILFGSRTRGEARPDSDYDLMIVTADDAAAHAADTDVRQALRDAGIHADVIMKSVVDYRRQRRDPGLLAFIVAREGRLLYSAGRVEQFDGEAARVREEAPGEGLAMWIRRAEADLRAAEQLLAVQDPVWDAICFHAHACAEKMLKALIVRAGSFPPRTHDLLHLLSMAPVRPIADGQVTAACKLLMRLVPYTRYPEQREPTPDEAGQAVEAARVVRASCHPEERSDEGSTIPAP